MAETQKWVIDPSHTSVEFSVRHMMVARVKGRFGKVEGVIVGDPNDLTKVSIEAKIDAASIDTREEQRDAHLRSADFFDVENHPHLTFKSTEIVAKGGNDYLVRGDLTIRGTTKPVELETTLEGVVEKDAFGMTRMGLSATGTINRKDFGLTWNMPLEAGGFIVSDEVKMELHAEATLQKE